jgi:hypothetical protein
MQNSRTLLLTLALGAGLAACGGQTAPLDEDLARDLQQVGAAGAFELAPAGEGTQVMSAMEMAPKAPAAAPAPSPTKAKVTSRSTSPKPRVTRAPAPRPQAAQQAPAPAPRVEVEQESPEPAAAAPRPSAPQGAGAPPPGGWRSVDEVIRRSRVPINP